MSAIKRIDNDKIAQLKSKVFYGIDLGTTYTVVAVVDIDNYKIEDGFIPIHLINIEQFSPFEFDGSDKSEMIASVLAVNEHNRMFVGNKLYRLKGHSMFRKDVNLFYHWKLDLGVSVKPLYKDAVRDDVDDASKVAGKILNYCRIQTIAKDNIWNNVIITVPASFQANQRKDVVQAIEYAGIRKCSGQLIDEPNAALLGYFNQISVEERNRILHNGQKIVLVVDFGGGTCDLSLLQLRLSQIMEVEMSNLAISRYNDLGGQDIDMIIAEKILLPEFLKQFNNNFEDDIVENVIIPQLSVAAEKLKIDLSNTISSKYALSMNEIKQNITDLYSELSNVEIKIGKEVYVFNNAKLLGDNFQEVISFLFKNDDYKLDIIDKSIHSMPAVCSDVLQKAGLTRDKIDFVLFAGGSVQNLLFVSETMQLFPTAEVLLPQRPDTLVAKGAAVYSFYKYALGVELIKPIVSDSIAVTTVNNPFYTLIMAGDTLPLLFNMPVFSLQNLGQSNIEIPFCIGNKDSVIQVLKFKIPYYTTTDSKITICGELSIDKVLSVQVFIDEKLIGEAVLENPFTLANVSEDERQVFSVLSELNKARSEKNTSKEKMILLKLIREYYDLTNYNRCIATCDEFLKKFDPNNDSVLNYLYCAYHAIGQRRKAEEALRKAYKYNPRNSAICYNMTNVVEESEGLKETLDFIEKMDDDMKMDTTIIIKKAIIKKKMGDDSEAKNLIEKYKEKPFFVFHQIDKSLMKELFVLMREPFKNSDFVTPQRRTSFSFSNSDLLRVDNDKLATL